MFKTTSKHHQELITRISSIYQLVSKAIKGDNQSHFLSQARNQAHSLASDINLYIEHVTSNTIKLNSGVRIKKQDIIRLFEHEDYIYILFCDYSSIKLSKENIEASKLINLHAVHLEQNSDLIRSFRSDAEQIIDTIQKDLREKFPHQDIDKSSLQNCLRSLEELEAKVLILNKNAQFTIGFYENGFPSSHYVSIPKISALIPKPVDGNKYNVELAMNSSDNRDISYCITEKNLEIALEQFDSYNSHSA